MVAMILRSNLTMAVILCTWKKNFAGAVSLSQGEIVFTAFEEPHKGFPANE